MLAAVLLLAQSPSTAPPAPPAPPPPACATPEHRAFDFWVGAWDVYATGTERLVAHSLIERRYNGCAIRENWMPLKGAGGGSLSGYDSGDGQWHQSWIDSSGARVLFDGGMQGDAMVLTGNWRGVANGKDGIVRMTYSREPGGGVRQKGDVSTDGGATWAPSFDFLYTPAKTG